MDSEFKKVKAELPSIVCNMTAAGEHVAKAERGIHTMKKKSRGVQVTLPFNHFPCCIKIELIMDLRSS